MASGENAAMTSIFKILIVDDEQNVLNSLRRLLIREKYEVFCAESASEGLKILRTNQIHVIICDRMMPEMDGIEFFEKASGISPDSMRILLTGFASMESALAAINRSHVHSFLTKPWSNDILLTTVKRACEHIELFLENKRFQKIIEDQNRELLSLNSSLSDKVLERTIQLEEAIDEGINILANAAEAKDKCTGDHIIRVRNMVFDMCRKLDMPIYEAHKTALFSILHDVGKIYIPDSILNKPGPLDAEEWEVMKTHTIAGCKILGKKDFYQTAREIARSHHENFDGSGYPDGLSGDKIPLSARIVAIADVYDALSSERPYKKAWSHERIIEEMESLSVKKFDPGILKIFMDGIKAKSEKKSGYI